jgi:hemerythrin
MSFIQWNDELSVGIPSIDQQHRKLIAMINQLSDAMAQGKGRDMVQPVLKMLSDYAVSHFQTEEALFAKHEYPDRYAHANEHNRFANQVAAFQQQYIAGSAPLSVELLDFLRRWLLSHIMGSDKKYAPHLKSKGVQ